MTNLKDKILSTVSEHIRDKMKKVKTENAGVPVSSAFVEAKITDIEARIKES